MARSSKIEVNPSAIAANVPRGLLLKIAEIVYQQNSPDGAKAKLPPASDKAS